MILVKRLVLDVLKPHHPSVLEFGKFLAEQGEYLVNVKVLEMDDLTETLEVAIEGKDIDFDCVQKAIVEFGASLHSIDGVEIENQPETVV